MTTLQDFAPVQAVVVPRGASGPPRVSPLRDHPYGHVAANRMNIAIRALYDYAVERRFTPPPIKSAGLVEANGCVVAVLELDHRRIPDHRRYYDKALPHLISTKLNGRHPVHFSNSSGLRFLIVLKEPSLSAVVPFHHVLDGQLLFLGQTRQGDFEVSPDDLGSAMLVTGAPGSGKSTFLNSLVAQVLTMKHALWCADPEAHTFPPSAYNRVAAQAVATTPDDVAGLLMRLVHEIDNRSHLYSSVAQAGFLPENLAAYNRVASQPLPRVFLFVEEANTYLANSRIVDGLREVLRRGRKWGIHVILAGHDFRAASVPIDLRDMVATRVAFRVNDSRHASVVLGSETQARKCTKARPGLAVMRLGDGRFLEVQTPNVQKNDLITALKGAVRGSAPAAPYSPLTETERDLVVYSMAHLDGYFKIQKLTEAFQNVERSDRRGMVTNHYIRTLAADWAAKGWLSEEQRDGGGHRLGRRTTPALQRLIALPANDARPQVVQQPA